MSAREWQQDGLCRQVGGDLFFPEPGDGTTSAAKRVCAACPVVSECLEYALAARERWGVWGGLSERERRLLQAERNRAAGVSSPRPGNMKGAA